MSSQQDLAEQTERLVAFLNAKRATSQAALLTFLIEKSLEPNYFGQAVKASAVLVDFILNVEGSSDISERALVRVRKALEALQKNLAKYYFGARTGKTGPLGESDPIIISILPGSGYCHQPLIVTREQWIEGGYSHNPSSKEIESSRIGDAADPNNITAPGVEVPPRQEDVPALQHIAELSEYLLRLIGHCEEIPKFFPRHLSTPDAFATFPQRQTIELRIPESDQGSTLTAPLFCDATSPELRVLSNSSDGDLAKSEKDLQKTAMLPRVLAWPSLFESGTGLDTDRLRKIVLLGEAGSGKTWLLRTEAIRLARAAHQQLAFQGLLSPDSEIPILLSFTNIARWHSRGLAFEEAVLKCLERERTSSSLLSLFRELIGLHRCTLLLDSWDEVQATHPVDTGEDPRLEFTEEIQAFSRYYQGRLLFSSRPMRYTRPLMTRGYVATLLPLAADQRQSFICQWFVNNNSARTRLANDIQANSALDDMSRLPLLLSLICAVIDTEPLDIPLRRAELYRIVICELLPRWIQYDLKVVALDDLDRDQCLEDLFGIALHVKLREDFTKKDLAIAWSLQRDKAAVDYRTNRLVYVGLLVRAPNQHFSFLHRTIQEYLTAAALAKRDDCLLVVQELSLDPFWHEVISLLGGIYRRPDRLVDSLSAEVEDCPTSLLHPRLALLGTVISECPVGSAEDVRRDCKHRLWTLWLTASRNGIENAFDHIRVSLAALVRNDESMDSLLFDCGHLFDSQFSWRSSSGADSRRLINLTELSALAALGKPATLIAAKRFLLHLNTMPPEVHEDVLGAMRVLLASDSGGELVESLSLAVTNFNFPARGAIVENLKRQVTRFPDALIRSMEICASEKHFAGRTSAIRALGMLGGKFAHRTLPTLLEALHDREFPDRGVALWAIGLLGPAASSAISDLIPLMFDATFDTGYYIPDVIEAIGTSLPETVIHLLVDALNGPRTGYQKGVAAALYALRPSLSEDITVELITELLDGSYSSKVRNWLEKLIGSSSESFNRDLVMELSNHPQTRKNICGMLREFASRGFLPAFSRLIEFATDGDVEVRKAALSSICLIETQSHVVEAGASPGIEYDLRQGLRHSAIATGDAAVLDVWRRAVTTLVAAWNSCDDRQQWLLLRGLGKFGSSEPALALGPIIATLTRTDLKPLYSFACQAIEILGLPAAKVTIPFLEEAISTANRDVAAALTTLKSIQPVITNAAIPSVLELLRDERVNVCILACEYLGSYSPQPEPVVAALSQAIQHDNARIVTAAANALLRNDASRKESIRALVVRCLTSEDLDVRRAVAAILASELRRGLLPVTIDGGGEGFRSL